MSDGQGTAEGQGFTIDFATLTTLANINLVDINMDGVTVPDVNCSDQGTTGYEKYIGGSLKEGGTYTATINWNLLDSATLLTDMGSKDTLTITCPKSAAANTAATHAFPAYINSLTMTGQKGSVITGSLRFKVAGDITITDEA